ncbi:hypothetical protein [Rhizobium sp. CC-YZS058]|uniref:hypothetical protein n=1 Tax=Rhizobium sp. CC-YZS058 TaxID=3042153 RepID=UPI002B060357|nr:hypothetical protein [Rhizobium sp. CC-YZS058]MEA3535443.1 hypothetical protein [Rhizobium sp. CC-YZS058]
MATQAQEVRLSASAFVDSVGICTHLSQEQTPGARSFDRVFELMKELGIRRLRDEAGLSVRSSRNAPTFKRIRQCVASGFSFSLICFDANSPYSYTPPSMLEAIYDWCDGGVDMFEGSNEPNLATASWRQPLISKEHQMMLFERIKGSERLRHIPLAGASYVQGNIGLALEQSAYCDYANIHPYAGMEHPETKRNGSLARAVGASRRIFRDKPAVVTEIGYHIATSTTGSFFPVSQDIKTRYLPRTLLWSFKSGIVRTYLYEFVSSFPSDPANPEASFGLITNELEVTPAFRATKALLDLCRGSASTSGSRQPYEGAVDFLDPDSDRQSLRLERADGTTLVPVWLGIPAWRWPGGVERPPEDRTLRFRLADADRPVSVHRFRDNGTVEVTKISAATGHYTAVVSDQMSVIEIG